MEECTIYPIPIMSMEWDTSGLVYRVEPGRKCSMATYVWYIAGTTKKILVDAGQINRGTRPCQEIQTVDEGLRKIGVSPNDIDIVVFTHLHQDHVAQAHLLPNAGLLAQKDEIDFAFHPHPFFVSSYPKELLAGLHFEPIEGDIKITDGVSVVRTPGHTVGGQSIAVQTAKGLAVISGICTIAENWDPTLIGSRLPVIPPTSHERVTQVYDNMLKIKQMADILIANHDAKYLHIDKIP